MTKHVETGYTVLEPFEYEQLAEALEITPNNLKQCVARYSFEEKWSIEETHKALIKLYQVCWDLGMIKKSN